MPARLFGAALLLALALAPASASDRAPKHLAMMSASDILRAIRCALPVTCEQPQKPKSIRKRKGPR
jgi:hypothetical protein